MAHDNRPLSPDMQVYRPQLTSVLSISHRVTGIALSVGTLLLILWLTRCVGGAAGIFGGTGLDPLVARAPSDARMDVLLILSSVQWHPAPRLGCGLRLQLRTIYASGWMVRGGEHGADHGSLDLQLCRDGVRSMESEHAFATETCSGARLIEGRCRALVDAARDGGCVDTADAVVRGLADRAHRQRLQYLIAWLKAPFVTIFMVLLLIALCHHMGLGLRVVVEDYVHSDWAKIPAVVAIRCACFALAVVGIFATLRIAFAG